MRYLLVTLIAILAFPATLTTAATDVKNDAGLSTGLVSYWELEEASGTRVDSHAANDLAAVNTPANAAAIQGNGVDLENEATNNEQGLVITDASESGLDTSGDFAVSFWVNAETWGNTDASPLVADNDNSVGWNSWAILYSSGSSRFNTYIAGGGSCTGQAFAGHSTVLNTGTWYHIVFNYNEAAGTSAMYKDGALISTSTGRGTNLPDCSYNFSIGENSSSGENFDGIIDEVGFWNRTLTFGEVGELYNSGTGIPYDAGGAVETVSPLFNITGDVQLGGDIQLGL
jgi:hypothetical protein